LALQAALGSAVGAVVSTLTAPVLGPVTPSIKPVTIAPTGSGSTDKGKKDLPVKKTKKIPKTGKSVVAEKKLGALLTVDYDEGVTSVKDEFVPKVSKPAKEVVGKILVHAPMIEEPVYDSVKKSDLMKLGVDHDDELDYYEEVANDIVIPGPPKDCKFPAYYARYHLATLKRQIVEEEKVIGKDGKPTVRKSVKVVEFLLLCNVDGRGVLEPEYVAKIYPRGHKLGFRV